MIAYISSWTLFWIGHWFSRVYEVTEFEPFYEVYNWCMTTSVNIQDRYDVEDGPWVSMEQEEIDLNSSDKM